MPRYSAEFRTRIVNRFRDMQEGALYTTPKEYAREYGVSHCMFQRWLKQHNVNVEKMTPENGQR